MYSNTVSLKAAIVTISSVKVSINTFVFYQEDSKPIFIFSSFHIKLDRLKLPKFLYMFNTIKSIFFQSYWLHVFTVWIDIFSVLNGFQWQILRFIVVSGNLVGWNWQSFQRRLDLLETPTNFFRYYRVHFFHQDNVESY